MARLITIAVQRLGITEVRFTGAEARNLLHSKTSA
jgi:hypothetical protein